MTDLDSENFKPPRLPTPEEKARLRHVTESPKWYLYLVFLIEFAERASYYGTGDRFTNFFQYPLPAGGSGTGAPPPGEQKPGALGKGLSMATSMQALFTFTSYCFLIFTGYASDVYVGQIRMLWIGISIGIFSHLVIIIAALPVVLKHINVTMVLTITGLLTLSLCTAFIKPVLLPLLLQQYPHDHDIVKTLDTGEEVIVDRDASLQRMTMTFYWSINIGSFLSLATAYAAQDVGYWLAFLIPMVLYLILPLVMFFLGNRLMQMPPTGESVLVDTLKVFKVCYEKGWVKRLKAGQFWEYAMPSNLRSVGRIGWRKNRPGFYRSGLVMDTKTTIAACTLFLYFVIYNMNDNQFGSLYKNQAGSMTGNGAPNDVVSNLNPLAIIFFMPLLDYVIYPFLRRRRINFKPVYRIFAGFVLASIAAFVSAVVQWRIYETSPCGYYASECAEREGKVSPMSLWLVGIGYAMTGLSECFVMTTGLELAFERSPKRMRSLVMALFLFTVAISAIITQILAPVLVDPILIRPFVAFGFIGLLFSFLFLWRYWDLDKNMVIDVDDSDDDDTFPQK